jgi:hypothetical protein
MAVSDHFSKQNPDSRDITRGEAVMTLRNLNGALSFIEHGNSIF